jgi:hypothetical protein
MNDLTQIDDTQLSNIIGMNVELTMNSGSILKGNIYSFHRPSNLLLCKYILNIHICLSYLQLIIAISITLYV